MGKYTGEIALLVWFVLAAVVSLTFALGGAW